MRKLIILFYLSISLNSCAQNELKTADIMNEEYVQKVLHIYEEVKSYAYQPSYTLHIEQAANFSFEILVNGIPAMIKFEPGTTTGSIPINDYLFKAGKQELQLRMFPPVDNDFNMAKEIDFSDIALRLSVNYGEYGKEKVADFKVPFRYIHPESMEKLPYFELNFTFEAPIVPYEKDVEGWDNSVDLAKEDQKALLQEVEAFYKDLIKAYDAKDVNALAKTYYKRQKYIAQSHYSINPANSQMVVDEWVKDVNEKSPFLFNDYALRFYAKGRVVALVKTDKYYLNMSALMREDTETMEATWYTIYLYRAKPGAPLTVIR